MSDKEEHGELYGKDWSGSVTRDCWGGQEMTWEAMASVCASNEKEANYDEIESEGSNRWRFDMHFTDRPEEMLHPCDNAKQKEYWAEPYSFEYRIEVTDNHHDQVYVSGPDPADESSSSNEIGFLLDIIAASGNYYAAVGAAAGDYIISGSSSTNVTPIDGDRGYVFDISLDGDSYDDLPHEENDEIGATQVSLRVNNNKDKYGRGDLKFLPKYTFEYEQGGKDYECTCVPHRRWKTTVPDTHLYPSFESVNNK